MDKLVSAPQAAVKVGCAGATAWRTMRLRFGGCHADHLGPIRSTTKRSNQSVTKHLNAISCAVIAAAWLSGCTTPAAQRRPLALTEHPQVAWEQAIAICEPRAQLGGKRAEAVAASQTEHAEAFNCSTSHAYGDTYNTTCAEADSGGGFAAGLAQGIADSMDGSLAYGDTYELTLKSCLAEYGWSTQAE